MGTGSTLEREPAGRGIGPVSRLFAQLLRAVPVLAVSALLFYVVSTYQAALRDPRFLDGWVLAGAILLQLYFHVAQSAKLLSPKAAVRWRRLHIFIGYLLLPAFILHSDFSLPDTGLEWALWVCFASIALSGVFGIFIAWWVKARDTGDDGIDYDNIPAERARLAREVHAIVATAHPAAASNALPPPPYDAWISELYGDCVVDYFKHQPSLAAHLVGSRLRFKQVTDEIDTLSEYVDEQSRERLAAIRKLVIEKDRLDAARVAQGLSKGWLVMHVPATYMLIVLTVVHVLVVYAFSSGAW
jgi:hypothetical protein